jgi:isoleucyl-tRNA synthetase
MYIHIILFMQVAIGSVEELFELSGVKVTDLHKEHVDKITIPSKEGRGDLKRIDEVFDCWFESGSMPYAQLHYPFENADRFENGFPADFIAEGLDQTRGWFYTLMVISTALFDRPAFKNLIVNGLVLAADGKKMSKRLNNYPDPNIVLNKYGADALRLYLINSPVVRADSLKFQEEGVNEVVRGVLLPWYNAFRFFIQCVDRWEGLNGTPFKPDVEVSKSSTNDVDVWILASILGLVKFVHEEMTAYRLYTVVPRLVGFIEELTNWYVRLNRDRLKGASGEQEALLGLNVLFEVLMTLTQIMAPFTPYFAEYLYQNLRQLQPLYGNTDDAVALDLSGKSASVHYCMLPAIDQSRLDPRAEARFKTLQQAVTLARVARERRHIRNNLPLKSVIVVAANEDDIEALEYLKGYFMGEINAWDVSLSTEWETLCALKVMPNWKDLGKRLGKQMKEVAGAISALTKEQVIAFMTTGVMIVCGFTLTKDDINVKREFNGDTKRFEAASSEDGSLMIAIDTTCDEEVLQELRARTFAATVQKLRKSSGLVVSDRVEIFYEESGDGVVSKEGVSTLVSAAMLKHSSSTVKRIKSLPLTMELCSKQAIVIIKEVITDLDISKKPITIMLTQPCIAVDIGAVALLIDALSSANLNPPGTVSNTPNMAAMYLQSMDYDRLLSLESVDVTIDNIALVLKKGIHYFQSANEMVLSSNFSNRNTYPNLPTSL